MKNLVNKIHFDNLNVRVLNLFLKKKVSKKIWSTGIIKQSKRTKNVTLKEFCVNKIA